MPPPSGNKVLYVSFVCLCSLIYCHTPHLCNVITFQPKGSLSFPLCLQIFVSAVSSTPNHYGTGTSHSPGHAFLGSSWSCLHMPCLSTRVCGFSDSVFTALFYEDTFCYNYIVMPLDCCIYSFNLRAWHTVELIKCAKWKNRSHNTNSTLGPYMNKENYNFSTFSIHFCFYLFENSHSSYGLRFTGPHYPSTIYIKYWGANAMQVHYGTITPVPVTFT